MRGGCARRSRRESCQAHRALPARLSEQNNLTRASVRARHSSLKDSETGGGLMGDDKALLEEDCMPP